LPCPSARRFSIRPSLRALQARDLPVEDLPPLQQRIDHEDEGQRERGQQAPAGHDDPFTGGQRRPSVLHGFHQLPSTIVTRNRT
jgi:hypothetical protein